MSFMGFLLLLWLQPAVVAAEHKRSSHFVFLLHPLQDRSEGRGGMGKRVGMALPTDFRSASLCVRYFFYFFLRITY